MFLLFLSNYFYKLSITYGMGYLLIIICHSTDFLRCIGGARLGIQ